MKTIVEVFQTNVMKEAEASFVCEIIEVHYPFYKTNFDLEDRDNILRVESFLPINQEGIYRILSEAGFTAHVLV